MLICMSCINAIVAKLLAAKNLRLHAHTQPIEHIARDESRHKVCVVVNVEEPIVAPDGRTWRWSVV